MDNVDPTTGPRGSQCSVVDTPRRSRRVTSRPRGDERFKVEINQDVIGRLASLPREVRDKAMSVLRDLGIQPRRQLYDDPILETPLRIVKSDHAGLLWRLVFGVAIMDAEKIIRVTSVLVNPVL